MPERECVGLGSRSAVQESGCRLPLVRSSLPASSVIYVVCNIFMYVFVNVIESTGGFCLLFLEEDSLFSPTGAPTPHPLVDPRAALWIFFKYHSEDVTLEGQSVSLFVVGFGDTTIKRLGSTLANGEAHERIGRCLPSS